MRSAIFLLWACGVSLRLTVLAVPPVISIIREELHLTGTQLGLLSGIPVVLFAIAATPGSSLIARVGLRRTLLAGLAVAAGGGALRALSADVWQLYLTSIVMSAGIAIMQPAMAAAVRGWVPDRAAFGTAVYTNGLLVGEIVPVAAMLPLVLPLAGSWRPALGLWSLPLLAVVIWVALFRRRAGWGAAAGQPVRWLPDLNSRLNWRIGMMLGSVSATYFCTNGFLPSYLSETGQSDLVSPALTALNFGQVPASILLMLGADRIEGKRWPYLFVGLLFVASLLGLLASGGAWTVLWSGLIGAGCGWGLSLCLSLSPLLCRDPDDVARTSAAGFAIAYGFAMLVSCCSGAAWDISGHVAATLAPILLSTLPILILAPTLDLRGPARD
jgi:CP family cyanate transporter-like MFS transporter